MKAVFVGGCPRSGTTLLGTLLATYLRCSVTPESQFKNEWFRYGRGSDPWAFVSSHPRYGIWGIHPPAPDPRPADIGDAVAYAVAAYARATDQDPDAPWIDHTPSNLRYARTFSTIPGWEVSFVHIVRDGRAVAASVMPLDWGPNTALAAGRFWAAEVGVALAAEDYLGERVLRVRFEDLLEDPDATVARIAAFAGLDARPGGPDPGRVRMPAYYTDTYHRLLHGGISRERRDAWRARLRPREVELVEFASAELLDLLGYASEHGCGARPPRLSERLTLGLRETLLEGAHSLAWVRRLRRAGRRGAGA